MKKIIFSSLVLVITLAAANSIALAQRETATGVEVEKDIALIRRDLRSEKKKIIALSVSLTETEATKFWPVYDRYAADMKTLNDEFYALVKDYAANQKTLTDAQAATAMTRWSELLVQMAQMRQKYVPIIQGVIPPRKAALFFQVDRRLFVLMDLQVTSEIPLIVQ
jgi:hypothetical protein